MTADAAGSWRLGDLTVNRLGFGAMRLTGTRPFDRGQPRHREDSIAVLRRAVELGVDHIDTAAFYFSRTLSANELINAALGPSRSEVVVVTKVGPGRDPSGEWLAWATPDQLRGQVEENLRQLGRDHLDVVNLRTQGRGSIGAHVHALSELVEAGVIRHIGVSNVDLRQLDEARRVAPIVCVQNRFHLDSEVGHDVLRRCGELDIAFVPFFSIAGAGHESGPVGDPAAELEAVAAECEATPAQVRLAWTLRQGEHVLVIPGTGWLVHLLENVAAADLRLSDEQLQRLTPAPGG